MASLITPDELNTYIGYTVPPDRATLMCELASGTVRTWCRWNISRETQTFVLDGPGLDRISIPTLYLYSVTSVTLDGKVLAADAYSWTHAGQLYRPQGYCWTSGARNISIVAVHGYQDVPYAVKAATLSLASARVASTAAMAANPTGLKTAATGTVSRTWQTPEPSDINADLSTIQQVVLGPYRVPLAP